MTIQSHGDIESKHQRVPYHAGTARESGDTGAAAAGAPGAVIGGCALYRKLGPGMSWRAPSPARARSTTPMPYAGGARAMPWGPAAAAQRSWAHRIGASVTVLMCGMVVLLTALLRLRHC